MHFIKKILIYPHVFPIDDIFDPGEYTTNDFKVNSLFISISKARNKRKVKKRKKKERRETNRT